MPPLVKPTPPRVDCQQGDNPPLGQAPRADEWIVCSPKLEKQEECTLSEKAALWIIDAVTLLHLERRVRKEEHACLDKLVDEGVIRK